MNLPVDGAWVLLLPGILGLIPVLNPRHRTWRTVGLLGIWSVLWVAVTLVPVEPAWLVRDGLALLTALAVFWPARLGIASISVPETRGETILRRASNGVRSPRPIADADNLVAALAPEGFPVRAGDMAVAARLFRRSLIEHESGEPLPGKQKLTRYFEGAANAYWRQSLTRHAIGPRSVLHPWVEDAVLRAYDRDFWDLVGDAATEAPGPGSAALRVVADLASVDMVDPVAAEARDALVRAMRATAKVLAGDDSADAIAHQNGSAEAMKAQWTQLAARIAATPERRAMETGKPEV